VNVDNNLERKENKLRKTQYLPLVIIAMITTITMASLPVKASPYVNFFINQPDGYIHGVDPVGEYIYRDVGSGNTGTVGAGDKRLTPVGSFANFSTVVGTDADVGKALVTFKGTTPFEKHTENINVDGYFQYGEYIYQDKGTGNSGTVGIGDVRLTAVGSYNAGSTVVATDTDIGPTLVTFKGTTAGYYEKHRDNIEGAEVGTTPTGYYDFAKVFVDVYVDCDLIDGDPSGMVGWNIIVQVDPDVLVPYGWKGATTTPEATGYFLAEFVVRWGLAPAAAGLAGAAKTDTLEISEQISPTPEIGAGNQTIPDEYTDPAAKLVTLIFISKSETDYSSLDMLFYDKVIGGDPFKPGQDGISDDYMTPDGFFHPATVYDGDYNMPPTPEFPLGIGLLMAIAPAIPIIYLWRKRPKKKVA